MHLGPPFEADEQALEVVQVSEGPFDDPAHATEPGAVLGLAPSDQRPDPALAQQAAVLVVVVAAVGDDAFRSAPRATAHTGDGRHRLEQRDQLGDVVAVAAGERPGERNPAGVYKEVVLGAQSGSINRARARRGAPFFACT
jgi:hypothetical protein